MDSNNYKLNQIENFLNTYENTLKQIYITAFNEHNKGLLFIDINSNTNGKCDTKYISLQENELWNNKDMLEIKEKIEKNEEKKAFFCLINEDTSIIIERTY
tara:strand:- start:307 stop:609 length:303 start_codon:yes stop_codon:yes gene_type:complete